MCEGDLRRYGVGTESSEPVKVAAMPIYCFCSVVPGLLVRSFRRPSLVSKSLKSNFRDFQTLPARTDIPSEFES